MPDPAVRGEAERGRVPKISRVSLFDIKKGCRLYLNVRHFFLVNHLELVSVLLSYP